jgi:hypothetical protein
MTDLLQESDLVPDSYVFDASQVNGRNAISWTRKFELDIYYVDNLSFTLDLNILYKTFLKVIKSEGINQSSDRPMQPFTGDN